MNAEELRVQADAAKRAAQDATATAEKLAADVRKAEREERQAKEAAVHAAHYTRLYEDSGQPLGLNEAQHGIVYALAWEQGHSSGYAEVEMYYGEFAELARKILAAN